MAAGKSLASRMMAAMAQQNCGRCGYDCAGYANALFLESEPRLTLCEAGGKETIRVLRELVAEVGARGARRRSLRAGARARGARAGRNRARQAERSDISVATSPQRRRFAQDDLVHRLGHWRQRPRLCRWRQPRRLSQESSRPDRSSDGHARRRPDRDVGGKSLREALAADVSLGAAPDALFRLLSCLVGGDRRVKARALANGEDPDGDAATLDVLAALHKFEARAPMPKRSSRRSTLSRRGSIRSRRRRRVDPQRVTLTVDTVRYRVGDRDRHGVASTFLGERVAPGEVVKAYVQKAHGFRLPTIPTRRS